MRRTIGFCFAIASLANPISANAESGYQVIQGTRVFTEIDRSAGVATFSNACGRQNLTQRELQGGAIPSQIIPCNPPSQSPAPIASDSELSSPRQKGFSKFENRQWVEALQTLTPTLNGYLDLRDRSDNPTEARKWENIAKHISCISMIAVIHLDVENGRKVDKWKPNACIGFENDYFTRDALAEVEQLRLSSIRIPQANSNPDRPLPESKRSPQIGSMSCLLVLPPQKVSSHCDFKDGVSMYRNLVGINPSDKNCPASMDIAYPEPGTGKTSHITITRRMTEFNTCFSGVTAYSHSF